MTTLAGRLHNQIATVCPIHRVSIGRRDDKSTWRINFRDEATEGQRKAAQAVIEQFDLATNDEEQHRIELRRLAATATAKAVPNWALWTQQDWATWRDTNISPTQISAIGSLADARAMLSKMSAVLDGLAKMEIALRDQIWPDLPE